MSSGLAFQTVERLAAEDLTKELTNKSTANWPFVIFGVNLVGKKTVKAYDDNI